MCNFLQMMREGERGRERVGEREREGEKEKEQTNDNQGKMLVIFELRLRVY